MIFLNPNQVLDKLELRKDMIAADFGAGSGGFAIPLAKRLEEGLVYALDIQREPLSALKSRAQVENVKNINPIRCDLERPHGSTLPDSHIDLVVVANTLFQSEDPEALIAEAERVLKKGGQLLIVDWTEESPQEQNIPLEKVKEITKLELKEELKIGKFFFSLLFVK